MKATRNLCVLAAWLALTGMASAADESVYEAGFEPVRIAEHREPVAVRIGPDGHLYVLSAARRSTDARSKLTRYRLDHEGMPTGESDDLHVWEHRGDRENAGDRPLGIAFDPQANADHLIAWITVNRDPTTDPWGGKVVRATIPPAGDGSAVAFEDKIIGLPVGFHEVNQLVFGPDGLLYICVGSSTTSGAPAGGIAGAGGAEFPEQLLSAAILDADVRAIEGTLDVRTADGGTYDPYADDAPVRPYATAIRQVYDVAWLNGRLYGGVNQNDVSGRTGGCDRVPDLRNQRPPEFLAIFERGRTYGFPNAARGECVLMGGRPTEDSDEWHRIPDYPPGVEPPDTFDPDLLHPIGHRYADVEWDIGGGSANGILAYEGAGPHHGRLIQCFYGGSGRGRIWTFVTGADGRIVERYPLRDHRGAELNIPDNLDIAQHPNGNLYVARYGDQANPVDGELWLLRPVWEGPAGPRIAHEPAGRVAGQDKREPARVPEQAPEVGRPPVVTAGRTRSIIADANELPLTLDLDGAVRYAGPVDRLAVAWEVEEATGPIRIDDPAALRTTAAVEQFGTYVLRLTARDGERSAAAQVTFTVDQPGNEPPEVRASADRRELRLGEALRVRGEASDDDLPDPPGRLIYQWTQIGPGEGAAEFDDPHAPETTVRFTNATTYLLRLIVSDGVRTGYDEFRIRVRKE